MTCVLVVSNSYDDQHITVVQREVERRGSRMFRFDIDSLIKGRNKITFDYQNEKAHLILSTELGQLSSDVIESVWYRKPFGFGAFGFVESIIDPVQRSLITKEITAVVNGMFAVLNDCFWLNKPVAISQAILKPYQLGLARSIGLATPDSIITSDPEVAKNFCRLGPTVFKPLAETMLQYGEQALIVETTLLTDAHLAQIDLIRSQPILLQRYVKKTSELRVTYIDGELFVARQVPTSVLPAGVVDWRSLQGTPDSKYFPAVLSKDTERKVCQLMQELDLAFGALDFAVDEQGNELFLEVNPNGQWFGYTEMIGYPAAAKIASYLVNRTDNTRETRR